MKNIDPINKDGYLLRYDILPLSDDYLEMFFVTKNVVIVLVEYVDTMIEIDKTSEKHDINLLCLFTIFG